MGTITLSTSLKNIYQTLKKKITGWGYDIYVTDSRRTKSRYLEIPIGKGRKIIIRLSDHPSWRSWKYNYDVYSDEPRPGAFNYIELIRILEKRLQIKPEEKINRT
jgi:hypothetical protein